MKMSNNPIMEQDHQVEKRLLDPRFKGLLDKPAEQRIAIINQGLFIDYPLAIRIRQVISSLLNQPLRPRMLGLLLISHTNNGKTTLIKQIKEEFAQQYHGNFVYVETPERTTLKEFYSETLNVLGYPARASRSTGDLRMQIQIALQERNVKMLFFDEIQNLLDSRRDHKHDVLNGLKSLNNHAQIPIVLVGIETAKEILGLDEQVADRYPVIEMPLWEYNDGFKSLLATFEAYLPLKLPSKLSCNAISKKIFAISEGKLGRVAETIRKSAIKAIQGGTEKITTEIIDSLDFKWC